MIVVVDSGICNMFSLLNAFEAIQRPARPAREPSEISDAERIVLPGVGSFATGMDSLRLRGFDQAIIDKARSGTPILGICLGMQLLADEGDEGGGAAGLGLVAGRVTALAPEDPSFRVPHVGWNNFVDLGGNRLLERADLGQEPDFYFVHSFRFVPVEGRISTSAVEHGHAFVGAFDAGTIFGCQFHPELSHHNGLKVLRAFADFEC